jgi:hypothetical protein
LAQGGVLLAQDIDCMSQRVDQRAQSRGFVHLSLASRRGLERQP